LSKSQFDSLADELAGLLRWDPQVLRGYTFLLTRNGEVMKEDVATGLVLSEEETTRLLQALDDDGLSVKGANGIYPVHPRLGISNVFRLSTRKDASVEANRARVDSLMAILASYRDRLEDRHFAELPREGVDP
jgi:hypothetical protein